MVICIQLRLAVDVAAVADAEDEDDKFAEFDPHDDTDVTHAIAPCASVFALESRSQAPRVVRASYALIKEANDTGAITASEVA